MLVMVQLEVVKVALAGVVSGFRHPAQRGEDGVLRVGEPEGRHRRVHAGAQLHGQAPDEVSGRRAVQQAAHENTIHGIYLHGNYNRPGRYPRQHGASSPAVTASRRTFGMS